MKTLIIGSTLFVLSLGLYLRPDTDKTCHDVGFQLEDKLAGLTNSAQNLRIGFEQSCDLAQNVAHTHGLETLVSDRLDHCSSALESEPLIVEDLERPCAIGGFSVAARL